MTDKSDVIIIRYFVVTPLNQLRKLQRPATHVRTTCCETSGIRVEGRKV
jgi:hypothetical protein